jgi:hypothetical protein
MVRAGTCRCPARMSCQGHDHLRFRIHYQLRVVSLHDATSPIVVHLPGVGIREALLPLGASCIVLCTVVPLPRFRASAGEKPRSVKTSPPPLVIAVDFIS